MGTPTLSSPVGVALGAGSPLDQWGFTRAVLRKFAFSSSYSTTGEAVSPAALGLSRISGAIIIGRADTNPTSDVQPRWNALSGKMQAFRAGVVADTPIIYTYTQGDIKGSANTDITGVGSTSPTNGALFASLAAANNTTPLTIAAQPDISRNVGIGLKNNTGGASAGNASDFVVVGLFRGAAQTETISFSAPDVATIANGSFAYKYGSKPFDSITSITPSVAQPANWQSEAGPGSKLGLPVASDANAESDLIKLFKNAANLAITGLYSTNQTVNFGVLADGDDISVEYKIAYYAPSAQANPAEVSSTTNLSTFSYHVLFLGE